MTTRLHPAPYSASVIAALAAAMEKHTPPDVARVAWEDPVRALDPMAGIGRAFALHKHVPFPLRWNLVELEREWADHAWLSLDHRAGDEVHYGDATEVVPRLGAFDWVVVSPPYGNRMADQYLGSPADKADPDEKSRRKRRNTYAYALGRKLSAGSGAALQWGEEYRALHARIWAVCVRALATGGHFALNCSDHIRKRQVQHVTDWHVGELERLGLQVVERVRVKTPRQRRGQNGQLRVDGEDVVVLVKPRAAAAIEGTDDEKRG